MYTEVSNTKFLNKLKIGLYIKPLDDDHNIDAHTDEYVFVCFD